MEMEDSKVAEFLSHVMKVCWRAALGTLRHCTALRQLADHFGIRLTLRLAEGHLEIAAQLRAREEAPVGEQSQEPVSAGRTRSDGGSSSGSSGSRSVKLDMLKLQLEDQRQECEREV